jgi:arginine N-succinyltransferase
MLRIRPVRPKDHQEILALAQIAGIGMSSLPQDAEVLRRKITSAARSFEGEPELPREEKFLFALEDTEKKQLAGTTGIVAHVGLTRPFYSYKLSTITQASAGVGIYSLQQVLHMVNDYTDATEIGSLFLHPDYRRDGIGKMLSRSRYLMLAEFPHLFSDTVISEVRGVQDADGHSPFYNNLARHFFKMEFRQADYIYATQGAQFIADLMPKYPIYVNLLPPEAQAVIGVPLAASQPALKLLKNEGFRYEGYVDLFDAGPTMQADRPLIRTVRKSHRAEVKALREVSSETHIICNTRLKDFMITSGALEAESGGVAIAPEVARLLGVKKGDAVRYVI